MLCFGGKSVILLSHIFDGLLMYFEEMYSSCQPNALMKHDKKGTIWYNFNHTLKFSHVTMMISDITGNQDSRMI